MIKSVTIKIKVSSGLKQNYSNLGYDFTQKEIDFKVSDLKKVSNQKVDVICDLCIEEYNIQYAKYNQNIKNNGVYVCKECHLKRLTEKFINNNLSLNPEYQKKKKETFLKNYGVDNPSKSEIIKEKKKETCLKNNGVDSGLKLRDAVKAGMLNKYGVESPLQSDFIKNKMFDTINVRYGVANISYLPEIQKKKEETCFENYGVRHPSQSLDVSKKQVLTYKTNYFEKHGVEHPFQRIDIFTKHFKNMFKISPYNEDSDLTYQSSYELDFLNYCEKNDKLGLITNGISVNYILESENTKHVYHADFYIEKYNMIIEIKSKYTYDVELYKNLMKEKYSKLEGYNFLFIINKDYTELNNILK